MWNIIQGSEGGERGGRERGEEGERGRRKGGGGPGEGRSLPYQSKNRSRAPDCLYRVAMHRRCHRTTLLFVMLFQTSTARLTNARTVRGRKGPGYLERKFQGTKVPWNERSRERMFQGTNSLENESSRERTVQGTNVPRNEWSPERKFHHGNECSRERIVLGTNIPDTVQLPCCF